MVWALAQGSWGLSRTGLGTTRGCRHVWGKLFGELPDFGFLAVAAALIVDSFLYVLWQLLLHFVAIVIAASQQ